MITNESNLINTPSGKLKVISASDWITEEDTPDPVIKRVMNEYVVIRPLSSKKTTSGGLIIPTLVQEHTNQLVTVGRVVGVGEFAGVRPGVSKPNIGDYVVYPKHGGAFLQIQGVRVVVINDDALFMQVSKEDLNINDKA